MGIFRKSKIILMIVALGTLRPHAFNENSPAIGTFEIDTWTNSIFSVNPPFSSNNEKIIETRWTKAGLLLLKGVEKSPPGFNPPHKQNLQLEWYPKEFLGIKKYKIPLGKWAPGYFKLLLMDIDGDKKQEALFRTTAGAHSEYLKILDFKNSKIATLYPNNNCKCFFSSVPEIKIKDLNGDKIMEVIVSRGFPNEEHSIYYLINGEYQERANSIH